MNAAERRPETANAADRKMEKSGRKVRYYGKGRCNLTNARPPEEFAEQVRTNAEFSLGVRRIQQSGDHAFFERQVKLDVERGERVFPRSGIAWDVATRCWTCVDNGVRILYNTRVCAS